MLQKRWVGIGALLIVLCAGWIAIEAKAYASASAGECATPAARRESIDAWRDVQAAAQSLESARLGGSRYAAAKVGGEADEAMVRHAEQRLDLAAERLRAAKAVCQVAE